METTSEQTITAAETYTRKALNRPTAIDSMTEKMGAYN
jgi:hypothetical protein